MTRQNENSLSTDPFLSSTTVLPVAYIYLDGCLLLSLFNCVSYSQTQKNKRKTVQVSFLQDNGKSRDLWSAWIAQREGYIWKTAVVRWADASGDTLRAAQNIQLVKNLECNTALQELRNVDNHVLHAIVQGDALKKTRILTEYTKSLPTGKCKDWQMDVYRWNSSLITYSH